MFGANGDNQETGADSMAGRVEVQANQAAPWSEPGPSTAEGSHRALTPRVIDQRDERHLRSPLPGPSRISFVSLYDTQDTPDQRGSVGSAAGRASVHADQAMPRSPITPVMSEVTQHGISSANSRRVESQTRTLPNENTAERNFTNGHRDELPHQAPSGEHQAYLAAIPMESAIAIEQGSISRNAELVRKRIEVERRQIELRKMEIELIELEEAEMMALGGSMRDSVQRPKAEQWVTATDRFGMASSFRGVPETPQFASTAHVPPPYDFQGYSRFPDYYTWRRSHDSAYRRASVIPPVDHTIPPQHRTRSYRAPTQYANASNLSEVQWSARLSGNVTELPTFSGESREWPMFIRMFEKSTEVYGFTDEENLLRLQRVLKGEAMESVGHLLLLPNSLKDVLEMLEAQYGRPDQIIEATIEKIWKMPVPKPDCLRSLAKFGFAVRNLCATIESLRLPEYAYNVALLRELVSRLPSEPAREWARHKRQFGCGSVTDFGRWISEVARDAIDVSVEPLRRVTNERKEEPGKREQNSQQPRLPVRADRSGNQPPRTTYWNVHTSRCSESLPVAAATTNTASPQCQLCKVAARRSHVKEKGLCKKCLGRHRTGCSIVTACGVNGCNGMHHVLLHIAAPDEERAPEVGLCHTHSGTVDRALLKYVPIKAYGPRGEVETFAFMDDGSSSTFIDSSLVEELGLTGTPVPLCIQWTGGVTRQENCSVRLNLEVSGRNGSRKYDLINARTVKMLGLPTQTVAVSQLADQYSHLRGLPIASYSNVQPRILIGVDNCRVTRPLKTAERSEHEPVASKTRLGWIIYGPCPIAENVPGAVYNSFHVCLCDGVSAELLNTEVKKMFSLDTIAVEKPISVWRSKEDDKAMAILEKETVLVSDQYESGLLWKAENIRLPCSKAMALRRYHCLKRRMQKDPVLDAAVRDTIRNYEKKGKIRLVFDAAATVNGISLNNNLLTGPDLTANLLEVLFKFREFSVAVVGDIREMFHQVLIKPADQRSQMIFWEGDAASDEPVTYAVAVMTFGAACSPSTAQYVKNHNAERFESEYPRAVECIRNEHYVDDMLFSVETEQEAISLAEQVRYIHSRGGFEIRNWISNSSRVMERVQTITETEKSFNMGNEFSAEKVLGMWWDTLTDTFSFRLSKKYDQGILSGGQLPTKRVVLRTLMSIYDPMGLVGQFLMFLKMLLQEIWRSGYDWDREIDGHIAEKWFTWLKVLAKIPQVTIPRCYRRVTSTSAKIELHIFCDASEHGMAAVAYFRLELQAAVLGARLSKAIIRSHRLEIHRTTYWTDSKNVVSWLNSDHRRYHQFVAFRIGELLETTDVQQWRWLPTKYNVADDGTKWVKTPDLSPGSRWFRGPSFLWEPECEWPAAVEAVHDTTEELRVSACHHQTVDKGVEAGGFIQFERFSKWRRLLRAVAHAIRFISNVQNSIRGTTKQLGPLTQPELAEAELIVFRSIQQESYPEEIRCLRQDERKHPWQTGIKKESPLFKLSPVLDDSGVIVMGGRRVEKRWGVIFTCLTVRAVHLEVAHTLSTGSCIAAVRRFIARRGVPREIISDCGTNFVGTARELRDAIAGVDHEALMTEFCSPELKWTFNPPGAPHFGGCWERLVRSVKKVLGHLNLPRRPTDEVLETALAEIELILNSRPLTYVPVDDATQQPLTPNQILLGTADGSKPPVAYSSGSDAVNSSWKAAQHIADLFWKAYGGGGGVEDILRIKMGHHTNA
uniref:uncharacterized protein LOC120956042 n=1 Tax=Anopheles coluzzii TaxID=1518534 RepID=UPI0020FFCADB|nr:uncharacterized protein LOC120956042 [Anopheles coluzzii]